MTDKKSKTAVLAFGRMNPPTTGHEKLINKTHQVAKQHGGTAHVVASHSHDNDKNPLPQDKKLGYIRKIAHPDVKVSGSSKEHPSILHHAAKLHAAGHTNLVVVSDKSKEFHKTLNKYNGKKSKHGHYDFKSIKVVSSGSRDSNSKGTKGISGSKMREYSRSGQHDKFKQGLPKALHPHAKEIHGHVKGGTQLEGFKEQLNNKKKFKPSGKKTEVVLHINPTFDRSDVRYGYSSKKGSPPSKGGTRSARFGEGRVGNQILAFREDVDINYLFELSQKTLKSYHAKAQKDMDKTYKEVDPSGEDPYAEILMTKKQYARTAKRDQGQERAEKKLDQKKRNTKLNGSKPHSVARTKYHEGLTADQHRMKMLGKLKKFDKSRVAAGMKPIFKNDKKETKPAPQKVDEETVETHKFDRSKRMVKNYSLKHTQLHYEIRKQGDKHHVYGARHDPITKTNERKGFRKVGTLNGYDHIDGAKNYINKIMRHNKKINEEVDPHIKTMIDNGDSDEKIKKMHPKITNDDLKKLREQVDLGEVLSRQARIKKALILRRFKHKIQRRRKMLRKKLATKEMLHKRSRRHAIKLVRKRFMGKKGEMYDKLGMADKIIIDKKVATKRKIIDRIAARLMPKIRKAELIRLRTLRDKSSSGSGSFAIPKNVKTESYDIVTEDNIFDIVDGFYMLTEKDLNAMEKKINKSDIDSNVLFEIFTEGLMKEGPGTPQQKGFHSLNVFVANINDDEKIEESMASWEDQPISGAELDRRYTRPMVKRSTLPSLKEFQATGDAGFVSDPVDPKKINWKDSHTLAAYGMGKKAKGTNGKCPFHSKNDAEGQLATCWNMGKRGDTLPEALSYPHQTAKKYKKDTPGQSVDEGGEVRTGDIRLQKYRDPASGKLKFRKVKRLAHGREKPGRSDSGETGEGEVGSRGMSVEGTDDTYHAIATRSAGTKSGWKRVKDTQFSTHDNATAYGDKYHRDNSGAKMYKVVKFKKSEVSGKAKGWSEDNEHPSVTRLHRALRASPTRNKSAAMDAAISAIKKLPSNDHYKKKADRYRRQELAKIGIKPKEKTEALEPLPHQKIGRLTPAQTRVQDAEHNLKRARKTIDKNKSFVPTTWATRRGNNPKIKSEDAGEAAVVKARHTIQQGRLKLQHARSKNTRSATRERMVGAQKQRHKAKYNAARSNEAFEQFMGIQNDE